MNIKIPKKAIRAIQALLSPYLINLTPERVVRMIRNEADLCSVPVSVSEAQDKARSNNVGVLKLARMTRGMNQHQLANAVQASEAMISKIETGRATPSDDLRKRISAYLEIPEKDVC